MAMMRRMPNNGSSVLFVNIGFIRAMPRYMAGTYLISYATNALINTTEVDLVGCVSI